MSNPSQPTDVAIIGAGLAGLSAALALSKDAPGARVSIFEKEPRLGGRVLLSHRPRGEQGAEFVLRSETVVIDLLRSLGLRKSASLPFSACRFEGCRGSGFFREMARDTLDEESANTVTHVLNEAEKANRSDRYPKGDQPGLWLKRKVGNNTRAWRFLQMLLAGETCAPLNHLTARDVLGSLDENDTYRIVGGSEQLVQALRRAVPEARLITRALVTSVMVDRRLVSVSWRQDGQRYRAPFDAVIITAPNGEQLLHKQRFRQKPFHAYISALIEYRKRWWAQSLPEVRNGLYTDGPLNFVEEVPARTRGRHVLRILLPNAKRWLSWSDSKIKAFLVRHLRDISTDARALAPTRHCITRWPFGLPCGGSGNVYRQVSDQPPICLAGDRFSRWPSMDGALKSGKRAAEILARKIHSRGYFSRASLEGRRQLVR